MTIALRGTASSTSWNKGDALALPSGAQTGDFIIVSIKVEAGSDVAWTVNGLTSGAGYGDQVYYGFLNLSSPPTISVSTFYGGDTAVYGVAAYTGVLAVQAATPAYSTYTAPAGGTATADGLAVRVWSGESTSGTGFGVPSGVTSRLSVLSGAVSGKYGQALIGDKTMASSDVIGTAAATGTTGSTGNTAAVTLLLTGNEPPNAPSLTSPANSTTLDDTVTQRLSWAFSSFTGDSQSKFDLRYSSDGGSTWATVSGTTPNQYVDIASGTFSAGSYEWQVRTYGATGLVGPWSASNFFTAATPPSTPTITAPTSGSTVGLSTGSITWSAPSQTAYEVRKVADSSGSPDTGTIYYDTGNVTDSTTRSVPLTFPVNNRYEHLQVRVQASGLWSAWADVRVMVSYTAPMTPAVTVTADNSTGTVTVTWTAPTPTGGAPTTASADVYVEGGPEGRIRLATLQAPAGSFVWYTPASGVPYSFEVVAVGTNGVTAASAWT